MHIVRRLDKGIFLITTLMVVGFLVLLVTTVVFSGLQGLVNSNSFTHHEVAAQAAHAGLTYIQSRIESTPSLFAQGGSAATRTSTSADGLMTVTESGFNVAGVVSAPATSNDDTAMMFRAAFVPSLTAYAASNPAADSPFPIAGVWTAPPMSYVSVNNLANPNNVSAQSYQLTGGVSSVWRNIPGQECDIIVEGLAVRVSDGTVLDRRFVESTLLISGGMTVPEMALICGGNINMTTITGGSGKITVNTDNNNKPNSAGILALGNINLAGTSPGGGASPPGYSNPGGTYLEAGFGGTYTYTDTSNGTTTGYVAQNTSDQPPPITPDQVPVPASSVAVPAGTWAWYDNQLYHIPMDYPTTAANGLPTPPASQTWSVDAAGTPYLNGVAADGTMPVGAGITTPATPNTLVLSTNVVATPISVGVGATAETFTVVTTPSTTTVPGACGPVVVPFNTGALNDSQLELKPPNPKVQIQLRSTGSISVNGTITGQGAVVATGDVANPAEPANVNFQAGSSLSQSANVGLAVYSAENVNNMALNGNAALLPQDVKNTTGTAPALNTAVQTALDSALTQCLGTVPVTGYYTLQQADQINIINMAVSLGGANLNTLAGNPQAARNLVQQFLQKAGQQSSGALLINQGMVDSNSIILVDQTFNGLIYAWNSYNQLGSTASFQLNGSLVVYGGNPAYSATTTGVVNMTATDITLNYSPTTLGIFAQFFGGTISLSRNAVDMF